MTLTAIQTYEDEYRKKWQELLPLETNRIRWEIANSAKPYQHEGKNTRENVFDAMREIYGVGDTFTLSELIAEYIGHTGIEISRSAMSNHLQSAKACGLLKQIKGRGGAGNPEAIWRRCK